MTCQDREEGLLWKRGSSKTALRLLCWNRSGTGSLYRVPLTHVIRRSNGCSHGGSTLAPTDVFYCWWHTSMTFQWVWRHCMPAMGPRNRRICISWDRGCRTTPVSYTHLRAHETVLDL